LQRKGINALALGRAAGNKKSVIYCIVFHESLCESVVAFCTSEYLLNHQVLQDTLALSTLLSKQDRFNVITIDEVYKIFDWLLSYRPAFYEMKQLQKLSCPIITLSVTLTAEQIALLQ